jgi:hypothetical protein
VACLQNMQFLNRANFAKVSPKMPLFTAKDVKFWVLTENLALRFLRNY